MERFKNEEAFKEIETFKEIIERGTSAFHVVAHCKERLLKAGFQELEYGTSWEVEAGNNYLLTPFPSMLIAVSIGQEYKKVSPNIRIATAHTDSPCLKIKANPKLPGNYYVRGNVEPYGGLLKSMWFDRPLGIAGKVVLKGTDAFHPQVRFIESKQAVCVIPSLAPHLTKGGEKTEMNIQQEMMPIFGLQESEDFLKEYLEQEFGILSEELLDYDLYLYNMDAPELVGLHQEMICAPRIDNLASVSALVEAMEDLSGQVHSNIAVAAMFDNEEIGSRSKQGADSVLLPQVMEKLGVSLGIDTTEWRDALAKGFLLSMDGAQGHHPNYPEKSDPTNQVPLGKGVVIKTSASQRYLSDSEASAVIKELCRIGGIPCQQQVNRSGMPGGQTLGPILAAVLPMQGADVGIPMLAMHSARELAACEDYRSLKELAKIYYQYGCE